MIKIEFNVHNALNVHYNVTQSLVLLIGNGLIELLFVDRFVQVFEFVCITTLDEELLSSLTSFFCNVLEK